MPTRNGPFFEIVMSGYSKEESGAFMNLVARPGADATAAPYRHRHAGTKKLL
jgi:hypothetical protein